DKGMDLKGRNRKQLKKLAQKCRLLLIPVGNPDGFKRFEPESLKDMEFKDLRFWGQGSWNDGSLCGYPECKLVHPMQKKLTNFLGCYFNDEGINIMHDEFHDPLAAETKAIIELVKEEGPDMILSLHSHEYPPSIIKTNYIPQNILNCLVNFTNKYYNKLSKAGLPENGPVFDSGLSNDKFNLVSFLYHISGAVSAVFENPHSLKDWCQVSLEETLEIQLKLYQTLMEYALERKSGQT
ncbi:MAG: M14 family zinc carboxypeptidase, partial [Bacillota bacterium]